MLSKITRTFGIVLLLSGCDATQDVGSAPDGGTADSGGAGVSVLLCSLANPCPAGEFCFNGLCALGCNSNGDCAADQYCDTEFDRLCHNKTVSTCPEAACSLAVSCVVMALPSFLARTM